MKRSDSAPLLLFSLALLMFFASYVMLLIAQVNPYIALIWNVLSSLDINFAILPTVIANSSLVLEASLINAFVFALLTVVLATFFFDFVKSINFTRRSAISKVKKLKNHVILVPYNNFAHQMIKELEKTNQKCAVITENEADAHKLYRQNVLAMVGDPKSVEAFGLANIGTSKYVVACSDDDLQNALIIVTAKSANARAKIVSKVNSLENLQKINSAGAFRMVMPEVTAGNEIGAEITKRFTKGE